MKLVLMVAMVAAPLLSLHTPARAQFLATADTFAVLGGAAVTNAGPTVLSGDLGVSPGSTITGFPPGIVTNGGIHAGDMAATQAHADVTTAYNTLSNEAFTQNLTGQDLGGKTLLPGIYHFSSSAFLTGVLTLDTQGNPNARFDFQIGSTLITATNSSVRLLNSASDDNVFWQVGSSATLDGGTMFDGHILAMTSITLNTGASIVDGGALALNGTVALNTDTITRGATPSQVPEPAPFVVLSAAGLVALGIRGRKHKNSAV